MAIRIIIYLNNKNNCYQPIQQILRAGPCNDLYSLKKEGSEVVTKCNRLKVIVQFAENKWSFHISVGINQKEKLVTKSDISKYDISQDVKHHSPIRLQIFMTFLDVSKIHITLN